MICMKFFCCMQAAWTSFHNNKALSRKYMAAYHIGQIVDAEKEVSKMQKNCSTKSWSFVCKFLQQPEMMKDFFKLRAELEEKVWGNTTGIMVLYFCTFTVFSGEALSKATNK